MNRVQKGLFLLVLSGMLLGVTTTWGQESEEEENDSIRFELEGYGEMLFQHFDYGPDQKSGTNGSPDDSRSIVDIPRVVFEMTYFFRPDFYVEAELEIEHAGTGGALELEYEEFGEYEQEFEKGGEVMLEQIHITKEFSDHFALRAGRLILPVGLTNLDHEPDEYFTTVRPEGESQIVPVTWNEIGIEAFGAIGPLDWKLFLVNGLDASGFSSENWIMGGHQSKFELTRTTDPAVAVRLDYEPIEGLRVGGSFYGGNSVGNRPKPDIRDTAGIVTIFEGDFAYIKGPFVARGEFMDGSLTNSQLISIKNSRLSRALTVPHTPVASGARAYSIEAGFDIFDPLNISGRLLPFVRYEHYNSMERTAGNIVPNERFNRTVMTGGINYFPIDEVVIKLDYSHRELGLDSYNDENTIGLSVGFHGDFLEL